MERLGILLACDHYPLVSAKLGALDGRLAHLLRSRGHNIGELAVYDVYLGEVPASAHDCDLWLISGADLNWQAGGWGKNRDLLNYVASVHACGRPIYGINHGEHVLRDACCPEKPAPATPRIPRVVRNPLKTWWRRDRLFTYCRLLGEVRAVPSA